MTNKKPCVENKDIVLLKVTKKLVANHCALPHLAKMPLVANHCAPPHLCHSNDYDSGTSFIPLKS